MGREKKYFVGGNGKSTKRVEKEGPGCMSGVFQLFDFHPMTHNPCFKPKPIVQHDDLILTPTPTTTKGIEAPRNSLELDGSKTFDIKQENFHFPAEISLLTKAKDYLPSAASDSIDSPGGAKTPSLVARLMGLDLLPESASPSSCSSFRSNSEQKIQIKTKKMRQNILLENDISGSRSLPDTPRISSSRRSDVDQRRLSVQINRENMVVFEETDYFGRGPRDKKFSKRKDLRNDEENKSPGHNARQIMKQVKENVSRRMGSDITNTINNSRNKANQEEHSTLKIKKTKSLGKIIEDSPQKKLLEFKDIKMETSCHQNQSTQPPPLPSVSSVPKSKRVVNEPKMEKCNKANCERFTQRTSKTGLNDKKCKQSQLANKESIPASVSAQSSRPSKQSSLLPSSSSSKTSYKQEQEQEQAATLHDRDNRIGSALEFRYVNEILNCTGIKDTTIVSFDKWFSPSHPLHPSTFHYLEHSLDHAIEFMKNQCNRKLLFDLVDEILVHFLKPYLNMKPWYDFRQSKEMNGKQLRQKLWLEITNFPAAKCEVLEDIDGLVAKDLTVERETKTHNMSYEQTELVVMEIEKDIVDTLVHETAVYILQFEKR